MRAKAIENIVIHCSAGFSNAEAVQKYFLRPKSQGGRGWRTGGYHRIIELDGEVKKMYDFNTVTNGVLNYNSSIINICYIGGVENIGTPKNPIWKGKDTRTDAQKYGIELCVNEAIEWLISEGRDVGKNLGIVGHRDFSKDSNKNGVIESWERIKECPSYDVMPELSYIYASADRYMKLPK